MTDRYEEGTIVYSIYGGVFTYFGSYGDGTHQLMDQLSGIVETYKTEEFNESRTIAWGKARSV